MCYLPNPSTRVNPNIKNNLEPQLKQHQNFLSPSLSSATLWVLFFLFRKFFFFNFMIPSLHNWPKFPSLHAFHSMDTVTYGLNIFVLIPRTGNWIGPRQQVYPGLVSCIHESSIIFYEPVFFYINHMLGNSRAAGDDCERDQNLEVSLNS